MASRADQEYVALSDPRAVQLLGGIEFFWIDRVARFEIIDFPHLGNVEQHAFRDDAIARDVDRALARTETSHLAGAVTVVHLAFPENVAERVKMGKSEAMRRDREIIE